MPEREEELFSFGIWVRRRRKALDLTQTTLAQRVGCAVVTIRKIEADSIRPSREIADRLALCLEIPFPDRKIFIETARAERSVDRLGSPRADIEIKPPMLPAPIPPLLVTRPMSAQPEPDLCEHANQMINSQAPDQDAQGIVHSPVSFHQTRAALAAAPAFQVPYPSNSLFVGREHDLECLTGLLDSNETIAVVPAITGTGGIGKTMLAAEFAHRYRERFGGGVFWLNMEDPQGVASQVAACAGPGGLHLSGYAAWNVEQQIAATRAAWQQPDRRLLIFDNLEDPTLLHWRPSGGGCRVLITTRRATWTARSGVRAVPLDTLARPDSLSLLLTPRYGSALPDIPAADAVCEALGDLPLAIALAGAYLEHYPSVSLADYAAQITNNPVAHESLNAVLEEGLPTAHAASIVATFALSYQRLQTDDPIDALARTLFHRAAHCAPVAIPRALLAYTDAAEEEARIYQRNVDAALHRLLAVGLLDDLDSAGVRLHRLLAAFARSLTPDPNLEQQRLARILTALLLQIIETGYPQMGLPYLEHARHSASAATDDTTHASLLNNLGKLLHEMGDLAGARPYYQHALEMYERTLGPDHPDTTTSLNNLGYLLCAQGELAGARPYLQRALDICKRTLGLDHPNTATSLNNLGVLLLDMGDLAAARPYFERGLAIRERALGLDHLVTTESLNDLGFLLLLMGDLASARLHFERALAIRERVLGLDHPFTATSLTNLGYLLCTQGELAAARPYIERGLDIRERLIGAEHPSTAKSLNYLGVLLQAMGDLASARLHFERALAIRERVLGPNHRVTTASRNNLGYLLCIQGDLAGARSHLQRALDICEHTLGSDRPNTATCLNNQGYLLQAIGDLAAARPYFERALAIRERVLGPNHPDTATSLNNLGNLLRDMGDQTTARPYLERACSTCERVLGPDHLHTAQSLNNLGRLLQDMGDPVAARSYLERARAIRERVLGPDHPHTATFLHPYLCFFLC